MELKAIIVDDEQHGRENLAGLLRNYCPDISVTGEADSVKTALELIHLNPPDLLFLDIQMPGANGFQLLEYLKDFTFEVIFVTAFDRFAIKAIRFSAADYILKPINHNELIAAIDKVAERIRQKYENLRMKQLYNNLQSNTTQRIGLPSGDRIEYADVSKIIRCQGEGNYTRFWFVEGKHLLVSKTLVEFEELLQESGFVRTHKTHLVNIKYIASYVKKENMLVLSNGEKIPVSRRRKEAVLVVLKNSSKGNMLIYSTN